MKRVNPLPTLLTLCNLICGFGSVTLAMRATQFALDPARRELVGRMHTFAVLLIFLAMIFDIFDGRVARSAGLTSRFGAELDSLSDVVSFGLAPAILAKSLLDLGDWPAALVRVCWVMLAIYVACAAVRLARYNVEAISPTDGHVQEKGRNYFVGLPTPAAAGLAASLVLLYHWLDAKGIEGLGVHRDYTDWVTLLLPPLMLLLAWLMISRVRYAHLGNLFFTGKKKLVPVMMVIAVLIVLAGLPHMSGAILFGTYVIGYLVWDLLRRLNNVRARRRKLGAPGGPGPGGE